MIFENTWQGETVLHEAFIDDNADVSIREVTLGGDPIEDFVSYHPNIGVWEADDEDDLIEEITTSSGWCIKSIDYDIQLK